VVQRDPGS